MLGRWRTQQNAKHLEEERLNAERERSPSDAASPRSPDASTLSPPSTPASTANGTPTAEPPATPTSAASDKPIVEPASSPASTANENLLVEPASTPVSAVNDQPLEAAASTPASTANDQPLEAAASTPASTANDQPLEEPASTPAAADHPEVEPASTANDQLLMEPASTPTSDQLSPLALDASTRVQRGTPDDSLHGAYDTPLSHPQHGPDPAGGADAPSPGDAVRDTPTSATEHAKGLGKKRHSKILLEAISDDESDKKQIISESDEKKSEEGELNSISKGTSASEQGTDISDNERLTSKKESGGAEETVSEDRERNAGESSKDPESTEAGEMFIIGRRTEESVLGKDEINRLPSKPEEKNGYDIPTSSDEKISSQLGIGVKDSKQSENSYKNSIEHTVPPDSVTVSGAVTPMDCNRQFPTSPSPDFPKTSRRSSFGEAREIYRRPPTRFETMNYLSQLSVVQCLQRAYGAAKTNKLTGCAVSCMELGVYVAIIPAIFFAKVCDAPLLCADKVISKSVGSVARVLSCAPKEVSCGIPGCNCGNPVICAAINTQRKY